MLPAPDLVLRQVAQASSSALLSEPHFRSHCELSGRVRGLVMTLQG